MQPVGHLHRQTLRVRGVRHPGNLIEQHVGVLDRDELPEILQRTEQRMILAVDHERHRRIHQPQPVSVLEEQVGSHRAPHRAPAVLDTEQTRLYVRLHNTVVMVGKFGA